jgi:crotonobetainyl-CoA:carnitine CoA-transferase CaiB-like acyl-CoA transferase
MAKVDVVVENFRAGTMEKMSLGYEAVAAENPGLIMGSISGFGVEGPYADRPAFDEIIQSMSGLASLSGDRDGPPMLTGTYVADFQGIQFLLVDMAADLEAARALVYDVAMRLERDPASRVTTAASLAKLKATDMLMRVAADAIQVVGGFGYTRACPLERVMRDAKCFQIFEGMNQIHRMLIARDLLR